nr:uncharacterized protein LOC117228620 isoform X3 [Megalopta genalis]
MYFRWTKRMTRDNETDGKNYEHLSLNRLRVDPERGILSPISAHHFNVTVECKGLPPKLYSAVLKLIVEDIPLAAISPELQLHVETCTNRRRKATSSVDVWVAAVEVRLQYSTVDEIKTVAKSGETSSSVTVSTSSYEYCRCDGDDIEEIAEGITCDLCPCKLTMEEMFSHYDMFDLKQFEPYLWKRIISVGIIRPTRALYIGVEQTYLLSVKNLSDKSMTFSWGDAEGLDVDKLKLCVCPQNGTVAAKDTEEVKITVVPVQEGIVQFLRVPCFVDGTQKIIMLTIECAIEPLCVTFYLPQNDSDVFKWKTNFTRVEWRVENLYMASCMEEKSKGAMNLLDKYKIRAERKLTNMNLDQGDFLKDVSANTSATDLDAAGLEVEYFPSTRTSETVKMDNFSTGEGSYGEDITACYDMVPFSETILPSPTQPVVIEFLNLPLKRVQKKTFIIKNETAIPTDFSVSVKNFHPVQCSCEEQIIENRVNFMFKQAFGQTRNTIGEMLNRVKQPDSGVVIYLDPLSSDLDPFVAVPVDIYVLADTWGIYVDELEISITGLPRYTLAIYIEVVEPPISLSITRSTRTAVPVLNYGLEPVGSRLHTRRVLISNTSSVPLVIDWHVFLIKPVTTEKIPPINVVYDICTPFTDDLSKELKICKLLRHREVFMKRRVTIDKNAVVPSTHGILYKPTIMNDTLVGLLKDNSDISDKEKDICDQLESSIVSTKTMRDKTPEKVEQLHMNAVKRILKYLCSQDNATSDTERSDADYEEDVEFRISVLPYYGEVNDNVCTVEPREMFMIPKHNDTIDINIYPDKCVSHGHFEGEFVCKVLGLIRIAPIDKYQDNQYYRSDGPYLSPVEFDVATTAFKPRLIFDISKTDRTFTCCINNVIQSRSKQLEITKTYFFYNNQDALTNVVMETYYPFHIKSTSVYSVTNPPTPLSGVSISGHGCAQVEIACNVDEELINTILHTDKVQEFRNSVITLKEPLHILYPDNTNQEVELCLQISIPSLKLSTYMLDFGTVYISETKKLTLILENLSSTVIVNELLYEFFPTITYFFI